MQIATLVIAVFGAIVGTASLTWNVVQFLLAGPRPKAHLIVGAVTPGQHLVTGPASAAIFETFDRLAKEGYTQRVIGVKVVNHGRAPTRVQRWSVKCAQSGISVTPIGDTIGPTLPYDLAPQTSETWVVDFQTAYALVHATAQTFHHSPEPVHVIVELGTGKTLVSRESLVIPKKVERSS